MFDKRSYQPELMDDLSGNGPEWEKTLDELESVNKWLGGNNVSVKGLRQFLRNWDKDQLLTIADMGCGGGDSLKYIHKFLKKRGIKHHLYGFDANEFIIESAKKRCAGIEEISFEKADVFSPELAERKFDIIHSSLFCHHFTDPQLVYLFHHWKKMASLGVIVNDLHRHFLAYYSIDLIVKLFSGSKLVRHDASLSVARAFKKQELIGLLVKAGATQFKVKWNWAFRWLVTFN